MGEERRTGVAFRPSAIPPSEIVKLSKIIDQSPISNIFVNDSSQTFDCLDICSSILAVSKGIFVGSGVIRILEHDLGELLRRINTLQEFSGNRFVLGVGTGNPTPSPIEKIDQMLRVLADLRMTFSTDETISFPKVFIATLKPGIAARVAGKSEGILLNFCSPEYAGRLVDSFSRISSVNIEYACYLKVFYSKSNEIANKMLIEEFKAYSKLVQYRKMFAMDGALNAIESLHQEVSKAPEALLKISLPNPSSSELREHVSKFRRAGITLPCIYPYFAAQDGFEFKVDTIRSIIDASG